MPLGCRGIMVCVLYAGCTQGTRDHNARPAMRGCVSRVRSLLEKRAETQDALCKKLACLCLAQIDCRGAGKVCT